MYTKDDVILELDVPGFTEKDFKINFEDKAVHIKARHEKKDEEVGKKFVQKEQMEQSFDYSTTLPKIDKDRATWEYSNGFLRVVAPLIK